jgi:uncharacterized protein (DUF305 family)
LKLYAKLGSAGLLLVVALTLVSCGGAGGSMQGMDHGDKSGKDKSGDMSGMNHEGMDHGSEGMASEMLMENGEYSDERFIDAMVPHHQGAVEMAEVALKNAEHEEIKKLSRNIISTQRAEIEELRSIKKEEFGTSEVPMQMSPSEMESMGMMMDPGELADEQPFDKAFIDAMIPHHESAIEMAQVAYRESDNPQIRTLAESIVDAQAREITQMKEWRHEWYPEG